MIAGNNQHERGIVLWDQHKYINNYNIGGVMTKRGINKWKYIQQEVKRTKSDKQGSQKYVRRQNVVFLAGWKIQQWNSKT